MTIETAKAMVRAEKIKEMEDIIFEEEDDYSDLWLMEGKPDGMTDEELIEAMRDTATYNEWLSLATMIIKKGR